MPFLTGIGLEGHLPQEDEEEEEELLALPAPSPRCRSLARVGTQDISVDSGEDPLDELQRLVRRTRSKMDVQKKVLHSFMSDVNQIKGQERSFSCTDLAVQSPSVGRATQQLQLSGAEQPRQRTAAIKGGPALAALTDHRSGRTPNGATAALSSVADPRGMAMRSSSLSSSRSQPTLLGSGSAAIAIPIAARSDFQALRMPARRAPPGALGRQKLCSSAAIAAGRSLGVTPAIGCTPKRASLLGPLV